jgi:hypothetical protein
MKNAMARAPAAPTAPASVGSRRPNRSIRSPHREDQHRRHDGAIHFSCVSVLGIAGPSGEASRDHDGRHISGEQDAWHDAGHEQMADEVSVITP